MEYSVSLILCEGLRDITLLKHLVKTSGRDIIIVNFREKEEIIRKIVEGVDTVSKVYVVNEEGKSNLDKNLSQLVSKMRSINRDIAILVIRDSDNGVEQVIQNIKDRILQIIEKRFMLSKPTLSIYKHNENCFELKISYSRENSLRIHLFIIEKSLEEWILNKKLDTIGKLKVSSPWFSKLVYTLERFGLTISTKLDDDQTILYTS